MPGRARLGSSAAPCGAERPGRAERPPGAIIFYLYITSFLHAYLCFYLHMHDVFGIEFNMHDDAPTNPENNVDDDLLMVVPCP